MNPLITTSQLLFFTPLHVPVSDVKQIPQGGHSGGVSTSLEVVLLKDTAGEGGV